MVFPGGHFETRRKSFQRPWVGKDRGVTAGLPTNRQEAPGHTDYCISQSDQNSPFHIYTPA